MAIEEVRIPDIGDAEDVEVIELCVDRGAEVEANDSLLVLESDKASMEVPAPHAGKVKEFKVSLGDKVAEGQVVAVIETAEQITASESDSKDREIKVETAKKPVAPASTPISATATATAPESEEVKMPDVGDAEGIEVIEVAVKAGDRVAAGDLLVVVESDKASMEIPAPRAGLVSKVLVSEGSEVQQDTPLVVLDAVSAVDSEAAVETDTQNESSEAPDHSREVASSTAATPATTGEVDSKVTTQELTISESISPIGLSQEAAQVYAGPAVRRMARELGVLLTEVKGTGNHARVTKEDVQKYVKSALTTGTRGAGGLAGGQSTASGDGIPRLPEIDFSKFGSIETVALSRVRQRGASNLHRSWLNVPHVTQHDDADVTDLENFRKQLKVQAEQKGLKLTPLAFIMKACSFALLQFPFINASLTPDAKNFVLKRYYHIGFAVDTPDGLLVPVVRDVDRKGIWQLTEEIGQLSEKARNKRLNPDEMQGGSFTISSLGAIGGTGFTPIVNAPEVAILGVSRLDTRPVWNGTDFEPRKLLPITLSYDHRAINGAEAGRFLTYLTGVLRDFRLAMM